ncbi:unnamed protein product [Rotaria sp. Silwood2]|nr:unnamed protein product [Rotaria sp. Silwood2]
MWTKRNTVQVLCSSDKFKESAADIKTDIFSISADLAKKLEKAHPLRNPSTIMPMCYETFPRVICMMNYTMEEAMYFYRQLFYSTFEKTPSGCDLNKLLDQIDQSISKPMPVIVDYGGSFETEHLHLIQCAFPHAEVYSIDILYEDLDLLVCNINNDERKWCIIPVFSSTKESDQRKLIQCLRQELEGTSSVWNGINISQLKFCVKIDNLQVYDSYTELLELKKIHFIDTIEKCQIIPCSIFMAYNTFSATPNLDLLMSNGLVDPIHTTIDMDYARGKPISYSYSAFYNHRETRTTTTNSNKKWDNVHAKLAQLRSIVGEKPSISYSLPKTSELNWLGTNMSAKLLGGKFSENISKNNQDDPMAHQFGLAADFHSSLLNERSSYLSSIDCINLSSLIVKHNIKAVTPSIVRQFIEQHHGGFWKKDDINISDMQNYPKNFVKECLQELLGSVTNLHIHIDSNKVLQYSFDFVRQLKYENPSFHIEMSFADQLVNEICQSVIVLAFECNQNYVLVYAELDYFLKYISECTSPQEIQSNVESSVAFTYALHHGQPIKWHQNLSFVYIAAHENVVIRQVEDRLLSRGLKDLNFISKKLKYLDTSQPPQYCKNQAIICFNFSSHYDYQHIPISYNQLDQWIFDVDKGKFTGPFITLYPNISKYLISTYSHYTPESNVGCVYNLICDNVAILMQWRSSLPEELFL